MLVKELISVTQSRGRPGAVYHCIVRGHNNETIFVTERDKQGFLQTLLENRQVFGFELLAFALLDTQAHVVVRTGSAPLEHIMSSQLSTFARSFNKHHERTGHVLREVYQSHLCHSDERILLVIRYVHQLPVRLGYSHHVNLSRWTSHLAYLGDERFGLVDRGEVIRLLGAGSQGFIRAYQSLMASIVSETELRQAYDVREETLSRDSTTPPVPISSLGLDEIAALVQSQTGVRLEVMRSKSRNGKVVEARRLFIAVAVMLYSLPVSDVAKFLNVHHSYVSRLTYPTNEAAQELVKTAREVAATFGVNQKT